MYCPECGLEYREGFTECSDCHVPLLAGTPPAEPEIPFAPDLDLVVVLETDDPLAIGFAKAELEQAGIPFFVLNEVSRLVNDVDPMLHKWVRVQVAADREAEAREVLAPLFEPALSGEEPEPAPD